MPLLHTTMPKPGNPARHVVNTLLSALLLVVVAPSLSAQISAPLEVRVPKAPALVSSEGEGLLVYELHITNFAPVAQVIRRIEVVDDAAPSNVLLTLQDTALANAMARPGVSPPPIAIDRPRLGGGLRAVVFVWAPIGDRTPKRVRHRLTIERPGGSGAPNDSAVTMTVDGGSVAVGGDVAVVAPPLRGGPWMVGNGPQPVSGHRRALIPVEGTAAIAQRFAIDYVKLDTGGRTFSGDRLKNENYYAQGAEALAVGDGVVADTKDSIPENIPGANSRAVPITLETVGGNYVIIDLGAGRYAFYAHLQPGSLRVKKGDRVRTGQVLGLVGNSGNSTEPHLHFHISDSPSPLASEGIPYLHEQFALVGRCRSAFLQCAAATPETRRREIPNGRMIIQFP